MGYSYHLANPLEGNLYYIGRLGATIQRSFLLYSIAKFILPKVNLCINETEQAFRYKIN